LGTVLEDMEQITAWNLSSDMLMSSVVTASSVVGCQDSALAIGYALAGQAFPNFVVATRRLDRLHDLTEATHLLVPIKGEAVSGPRTLDVKLEDAEGCRIQVSLFAVTGRSEEWRTAVIPIQRFKTPFCEGTERTLDLSRIAALELGISELALTGVLPDADEPASGALLVGDITWISEADFEGDPNALRCLRFDAGEG